MKDLIELTNLVKKNKLKQLNLLESDQQQATKVGLLYNTLRDGVAFEDAACMDLLGMKKSGSASAFSNIKASLRSKLINIVFYIDVDQSCYNGRQRAYHNMYKSVAAASILDAKHAPISALNEWKKVCKLALKYEFTELAKLAARRLSLYYATKEGSTKKFSHYRDLSHSLRITENLECLVEESYAELIVSYVNSKSKKVGMRERANALLDSLPTAANNCQSYNFKLYEFLIKLFRHTCENDYVSAMPVADEMISFFRAKPYEANTPVQIALHHKLIGEIQDGNYVAANTALMQSRKMLEEGSFNWFKNHEYDLLISMHSANYANALLVYLKVVEHSKFKVLPPSVNEVWKIYQAYLQFLIEIDALNVPTEAKSHFTSFRINKFLNELPLYSKDKGGMNVAVLIVQILFYLKRKNKDMVLDRMEAIEKYCSRYLVKSDLVRAYYFIKLLLIIPKAGFNKIRVEKHAQNAYMKLVEHDQFRIRSFHKLEIIPFEILWMLTLKIL